MDHTADPDDFSRLLDAFPAAFGGNRLNLLLLNSAEAIRDGPAYLQRLDAVSLVDERREYLLDDQVVWPFPRARLESRPDPWVLSDALFSRFDIAPTLVPTQGDIAEIIDRRVQQKRPRAVALIIADGVSYYDLPLDIAAEPTLVAGISSTTFGYRQVIGKPSVSRRLFALGFANQHGFTYFDRRTNDLARDVYATFSESQITRVRAFEEILQFVSTAASVPSFFQITMSGLDQLCHAHWDQPPRQQYLERILDNYEALAEALRQRFGHALTFMTADHGILWREQLESRLQIADELFAADVRSPRYVKGPLLRAYGRVSRCAGQSYTLLRVPFMTRRFRSNEWGVHGGISAWESIVPLLMHED